jgi:hypothetical protein
MARQSKSGTKRKKRNPSRRPQSDAPITGSSGVMGSMTAGLKAAVGVGGGDKKKKSSVLGNFLWLLVIAAAAGFLFYRYNQ